MAKPGKAQTIRNVRNWSKFLGHCLRDASSRKFIRFIERERAKQALLREEGKPITRVDKEKLEAVLRAAKRVAKAKGLSRLEREVVVKVISNTALKNIKIKERMSAKTYSTLLESTRKLVRANIVGDNPQMDAAAEEILRTCGPQMGQNLIREIYNLRGIVDDLLIE